MLLTLGLNSPRSIRWALRTEMPATSAATCWLSPSARLAMYRSLIRNDRGAGIAELQVWIGALLSRPETRLCSCADPPT